MNNLNLSNYFDVAKIRNAVGSARNAARVDMQAKDSGAYDKVRYFELQALYHEMDAKVFEIDMQVLSKKATAVEIATQNEAVAKIALARAHRDVADEKYELARIEWHAE